VGVLYYFVWDNSSFSFVKLILSHWNYTICFRLLQLPAPDTAEDLGPCPILPILKFRHAFQHGDSLSWRPEDVNAWGQSYRRAIEAFPAYFSELPVENHRRMRSTVQDASFRTDLYCFESKKKRRQFWFARKRNLFDATNCILP
jgi:hypothetical protein